MTVRAQLRVPASAIGRRRRGLEPARAVASTPAGARPPRPGRADRRARPGGGRRARSRGRRPSARPGGPARHLPDLSRSYSTRSPSIPSTPSTPADVFPRLRSTLCSQASESARPAPSTHCRRGTDPRMVLENHAGRSCRRPLRCTAGSVPPRVPVSLPALRRMLAVAVVPMRTRRIGTTGVSRRQFRLHNESDTPVLSLLVAVERAGVQRGRVPDLDLQPAEWYPASGGGEHARMSRGMRFRPGVFGMSRWTAIVTTRRLPRLPRNACTVVRM